MNTNNTNTNTQENATMNAPLAAANAAAAKHLAKGTQSLGTVLILTFDGIEVPVSDAVQLAQAADLDADDLPVLRDRGAVRKALMSLGIYPSSRYGPKGDSQAAQATDDDECLRYSYVKGEGGDGLFLVMRETIDRSGGTPTLTSAEVQRLAYYAEKRELKVYEPLLRDELSKAFDRYRGAYKSDSVRSFAAKVLDKVKAVKLAGSTWYVPAGGEEAVAKLRVFFRSIPSGGVSFVGVPIMDEPAAREEVAFNASIAVRKEADSLLAELAGHEKRRDEGDVRVRDATINTVLDKGRDLREKLRTLKTLLGLEVSEVAGQLDKLQEGVQAFLEQNAQAEALRLQALAQQAAAKKGQ